MQRFRTLTVFFLLLCAPAHAVETTPVTIVAEYPHDAQAFTQGIHWHDGRLYESTGLYGRSSLREVELDTGRVLRRRDLGAREFGEDLTVVGSRLIQLTWHNRYAYVWDLLALEPLTRVRYAHRAEGWGLTYDGESLITSDGSARLRFVDPISFAVRRELTVTADGEPLTQLNALQWIDGKLYANVWQTTRIAEIDPATGEVTRYLDLAPAVARLGRDIDLTEESPNGIAYDADKQRVFVTGKLWPKLFEVEWE